MNTELKIEKTVAPGETVPGVQVSNLSNNLAYGDRSLRSRTGVSAAIHNDFIGKRPRAKRHRLNAARRQHSK